jgi:hypothetical protein
MSELAYVYAIVPSSLDVSSAPSGIDDRPVVLETSDGLGALLSYVDATEYDPAAIEARTSDVAWIGPRARAHDRVHTWASDTGAGALVPLAMFTLFRDRDSVREMIVRRRNDLERALTLSAQGRELGIRVFRLTADVERALSSWSPRIQSLESEIAAATPGQQYLLKRKLEATRAEESRRLSAETAHAVHQTLAAHALRDVRVPLPAVAERPTTAGDAILDAAFFVAHDRIDAFRAALTAVIAEWEPRGFRFEFSGPWPPYHFVQIDRDDV